MKAAATKRKAAARRGTVKGASVKGGPAKPAVARTQRERLEGKESAIVGAASALFAAQGFAKTTMSDIAAKAHVAEGTLYLYFDNKNALARAVLAAFYERLTAAAEAGVRKRKTTSARLEFLARHHLDNIIRERRLLELISTADRNPETYEGSDLYKMNRDYVAVFDGVLRDGLWRGDIAEDRPLWLTRDIFFGGLEYAMRTILMKRRVNGKDVDEAVRGLVSLLVAKPGEALRSNGDGRSDDLNAVAERLEAAATRLESLADAGKLNRKARQDGG